MDKNEKPILDYIKVMDDDNTEKEVTLINVTLNDQKKGNNRNMDGSI
jgi:hypothetical protein